MTTDRTALESARDALPPLLRCPFCNMEARWFTAGHDAHGIECSDGDCPGRAQTNVYGTEHKHCAVDDWNTRRGMSPEDVAAEEAAVTAALSSPPVLPAEPEATYMGHRLTPEGTKEFWGWAEKPLPMGTKLYAAPQACAPAMDDARMLDWMQHDLKQPEPIGVEYRDGAFGFPYLVSGAGGFGGGVGFRRLDTLRDAIRAAMQQEPRS